jgi:exodeoxyribonuclease VII large subunit
VISAVGHEPDVTIADYVADLRAATPSNAAELAVPDRDALVQYLDQCSDMLTANLNKQLNAARRHLQILSCAPSLQSPLGYFSQRRDSVLNLRDRLVNAQRRQNEVNKRRYITLAAKLDAMSPLKVMTRGYSLVMNEKGDVISSVKQVKNGDAILVKTSDGQLRANVYDVEEM